MKTLSRRSHIIRALACVMMFAIVLTAVNVPAASAKKTVAGKTIKLKKKATITVGDTLKLKATVNPKKATVTWKTSNKKVATVKNGKVTAKKAGKANITASIKTAAGKTKKAVCKVTVQEQAGGTGDKPAASTDPAASTGPAVSTAPAAENPAPPAADVAALDAAKPLEQREYNLAASMYINTAGGNVLSASATVNGAGTYTLAGKVAAGTAKNTDMTAFTVDTGVPISSVVYKVTDIKLTKKGKDVSATYALSENAGGTWEIDFFKVLSGFNAKVTGDEDISVQYTVAAQTPEESAASLAKALKKIPLRAGGTNNIIEAKIKVNHVPEGGAQVGISYGLNNSWQNAEGKYVSDSSFLKLDKENNNIVVGDVTDTNPADGKVHTFTTEGEEFTYTLTGLHDAPDIESLQFQSNVSNKNETFEIEIVYIKINGHDLSILGTPRGTETDKTHYMCDFDSNGTFAACGRNIYGGYTTAVGNSYSQLSWFWEGTTIKEDGTSANNISRTALY